MALNVQYEPNVNNLEKQIRFLDERLNLFAIYNSVNTNISELNEDLPSHVREEYINNLICENKKLKNLLILREDVINQSKNENDLLKHHLAEKIKEIEMLNIELDIVKKERNDTIYQVHNLVNLNQKTTHNMKESISSINSFSTNEEGGLKNILDKVNNEKIIIENMLYDFKLKYAEIQNDLGKYKDQNLSLRKKLDCANGKIIKNEEIIQKFLLSKEKIPLLDSNHASRLDLTIALSENSNFSSIKQNSNVKSGSGLNSKFGFNSNPNRRDDFLPNNRKAAHINDISFSNLQNIKGNYNTGNNVSLVSSPDKNPIIKSVKENKENGSIFKKIKNMIFSDRKTNN